MPRLRSSSASGVFSDQGSNPRLLCWQVDSLPLSLPGSPHHFIDVNGVLAELRSILALSMYQELENHWDRNEQGRLTLKAGFLTWLCVHLTADLTCRLEWMRGIGGT